MKKFIVLIFLFALLLIASTIASAIEPQAVKKTTSTPSAIITSSEQVNKTDNPNKTSSIDGTTSASELSAQRSHSVSEHDETGLSIFLGLIVLSVIGFFLKPFR